MPFSLRNDDYEPPSGWENLTITLLLLGAAGLVIFWGWWFSKGIFNN